MIQRINIEKKCQLYMHSMFSPDDRISHNAMLPRFNSYYGKAMDRYLVEIPSDAFASVSSPFYV